MRILIIEDDDEACKIYEEEIQGYNETNNKNITSIIKKNKEDGLKSVNEEDFDAVIVDLNLGSGEEAGGNEIIKKIFNEKRVPIYIVSGTPDAYEEIEELSDKKLLLRKITRGEVDIITILDDLLKLYDTGLTKILNRKGILDKIMDEIFLKYSENLVTNLQKNNELDSVEKENIKKLLQSKNYKNYYEYLPINNEEGQAINFSDLVCLPITEINEYYDRESSLNETFLKEIIFNFSQYYGRQGIPEIHK